MCIDPQHGLPQHLSAWQKMLRETYGYETHFLHGTRRDSGQRRVRLSGVMPLFLVRQRLTGRRAMTMPGGICAEDAGAAQSLAAAAEEDRRAITAPHWFRSRTHASAGSMTTTTVNGHVGWIVDVSGSEEELSKRLHRNIRRQVRMADENGLRVQIDRTGELVDDFYRMLSRFTHQAGTPIFGRDFLNNVVRYLAAVSTSSWSTRTIMPSAAISSWRWATPSTACGAQHYTNI